MEINGVPLHPLVVHAAVVLTPLAAVAILLFTVPRWRWLARWPALLLMLGATATAYLATVTGEDLEESRGLETTLVERHAEWADRLMISMYALSVVTVVAFWVLPHVTRLAGGRDREARAPALEKPLMVVLPLLAVVMLVLVVLPGDAGAKAVWQQ